ncbi:DUF2961 domain-containing protein [Sphingomonas sp. LB-2]|uniref:glycoside hydrolase family 172 protein n=1 Tax=Sphingomonas caeni TaxID=2984949 RepID=UPI002230A80F|nr:glycoside hydrolase family 172 protein [Sphingomonas caeni]MCW3848310.1 DUF2961 domain-containing protein [Sphingomonas caeni]
MADRRGVAGALVAALCALLLPAAAITQEVPLYQHQPDQAPRWASPENPNAEPGAGGRENRGAKGHPFETIPAGGSLVLADIKGPGVIDRMWLTTLFRTPEVLRSLRLEIWWDGARTPAVSAPLGDFFLGGAGEMVRMETALFASPEGRSFVSYIPMPFRKGARIVLTNDGASEVMLLFYDVDFRRLKRVAPDTLYFHAWWSRDRATRLGEPFAILPRITGRGRFLGATVTVFTNPAYGKTWWGEGEMKIFLDGDRDLPTLIGTGTEDYIGSGWEQGSYVGRFQGSLIADADRGRWSFYRFHIPDPIFFNRDLRVALPQMGGAQKADVMRMMAAGVPLVPVNIAAGNRAAFVKLLDYDKPAPLAQQPDGWVDFYRSDDVSAVAYFYLDRPENGLPPIAPVAERVAGLRPPK